MLYACVVRTTYELRLRVDKTSNTFVGGFSPRLVFEPVGRLGLCLQKGGVPAAPSGTATLLRLSPSHRSRPWPLLAVTDFRRSRLPWLDGRCVQGPGTYSPRHG